MRMSLKILFILISIGTFIFDVGLDIVIAVKHYNNGNKMFCYLTICFIALPAVVNSLFSLHWYIGDEYRKEVSTKHWIVRGIFLCLGLAPILRNFEALYYAWKNIRSTCKEEKLVYERRVIYENADASNLRLFEAFLECAPQLIIQIYIFAQVQSLKPCSNEFTSTEIQQSVSIFSSLISMSWAITSFLRILRESLDEKKDLTISASAVVFLWHFFELTSRTLVLGLFASISPYYFCIVCLIHFTSMFIWIRFLKTEFCDSQCGEYIYNIVLGIIFIFCYFNPKDTPTKQRRTSFYTLMFLENAFLMYLWLHFYPENVFMKITASVVCFVSFFFAVSIMIAYYIFCHPSRRGMSCQTTEMEDYCNGDVMTSGFDKNEKPVVRENHEINT